MGKIRLRYSKAGQAKYISHLDLMATMHRALIRAGIELKYSEGFNPHPYMSVALPLPVGLSSVCELMDFELTAAHVPAGLPNNINKSLPHGIIVLEAYEPERKFSDIAWTEISGSFTYDTGAPPRISESLTRRFMEKSIVISKKTKRGLSDVDIAPFIRDITFRDGDRLTMTGKISAQNPSLNPENLMSALTGEFAGLSPDFHVFTRTEVFDGALNIFR